MSLLEEEEATQHELLEVEIGKVKINPFQPRRNFSTTELEELASSIQSVGVVQPPVVRRTPEGNFELVSGERRLRACKIAGMEKIPVLVRPTTNADSAQAALIENVQRVDLNAIEIAKGLRRLMEAFGFDQDDLSTRVGKKRSTIANYLRLLSLPKVIQDSVSQGDISMGHAKAILSIPTFEQQMILHKEIIDEKLSVRETEKRAAQYAKQSPSKRETPPSPEEDVHLAFISARLQEKLGTKVLIQPNGKNGRIVIDYYDDLDRLLEILGVTN